MEEQKKDWFNTFCEELGIDELNRVHRKERELVKDFLARGVKATYVDNSISLYGENTEKIIE